MGLRQDGAKDLPTNPDQREQRDPGSKGAEQANSPAQDIIRGTRRIRNLASLATDSAGDREGAERERGDTEGKAGHAEDPLADEGRDAEYSSAANGDAEGLPTDGGRDAEHSSTASKGP